MKFVEKRDGRIVDFDKHKIKAAILKAFIDVDGEDGDSAYAKNKAAEIANWIDRMDDTENSTISVEKIQDVVEDKLMGSNRKDVARAYILYRNERAKIRARDEALVKSVLKRMDASVDNRSNANVDEKSFSGREKEASADVGKAIALDYGGLSEEVANAHKEMLIYQHDLEKAIYGVHNCLNLNFQEIFEHGFRTRNGDVRPPASYSTACQQMAVAFQCQSQVQFGGCGTIHADVDLAPFVKRSFKKYYQDGKKYIQEVPSLDADDMAVFDSPDWHIDNEILQECYPKTYKYAMDMLEREGKQATEALWHNLNTLESRQGSQVPFTSLNVGRDTSVEGRAVTRWMLNASIDGIGQHHLASIFPISIFQYKEGCNANPGDPNYDLKQLALKSMSKRIYPNFCNCSWTQAHEVDGDIDTYFSTINKSVA